MRGNNVQQEMRMNGMQGKGEKVQKMQSETRNPVRTPKEREVETPAEKPSKLSTATRTNSLNFSPMCGPGRWECRSDCHGRGRCYESGMKHEKELAKSHRFETAWDAQVSVPGIRQKPLCPTELQETAGDRLKSSLGHHAVIRNG